MLRSTTIALLFLSTATAASAQMHDPAVREACSADVARLCSATPQEPKQVMQCMRQHRTEISAGCLAAVKAHREAAKANHAAAGEAGATSPH